MLLLNAKQIRSNLRMLWGILLLLLSACAPASSGATNPPTEGPTQTAAPTALAAPSYTNPVYKGDFPDPVVLRVGDTYYGYGTTNGSTTNIRMIRSNDLINWEELGDALPALPEWAVINSGYTWAPGVLQIDDNFMMYYVARDEEVDRQCIGIAVSDDPDGPFIDPNDEAFVCQARLGGSIDAQPFKDDDGKLYLLWKNDGNCCGLEVALWIQELSQDGLTLVGEPVKLIKMDQAWERPLIENPAMVKHNDKYYLFYSGNWWESHRYAIGYAICETVTGPCEKPLDKPWFEYEAPVMGPGGQSFFTDEEGNLWMAYHAWTGSNVTYSGGGKRSLHIDLVTFEGDKPVTNGPTYTPQLLP
ncbi:MAG TPA: glycoside hydrolase family 43 protein [Anaerolineales bacterium]|nr:glycoside hydrolase family 43 protein [Anaerolineales bacterium]